MIYFFRRIRKQLASENKFQKYFRYAFGEVVLIMLGIFMALQLQNWNEQRKQEIQFKNTLEQIYNAIDHDLYDFEHAGHFLNRQFKLANSVFENTDSIPLNKIPYVLAYFDANPDKTNSESEYFFSQLKPDPNNNKHSEIAQIISNYISWVEIGTKPNKNTPSLRLYLLEKGLPTAEGIFGYSDLDNFNTDQEFNSLEDQVLARLLIDSIDVKNLAKNILSYKGTQNFIIGGLHEDGTSIMQQIKDYHPEVKLLYRDIGIIGDAMGGWFKSTPMTLIDEYQSIWELTAHFQDGEVKFRGRNSWNQNWGTTKDEE